MLITWMNGIGCAPMHCGKARMVVSGGGSPGANGTYRWRLRATVRGFNLWSLHFRQRRGRCEPVTYRDFTSSDHVFCLVDKPCLLILSADCGEWEMADGSMVCDDCNGTSVRAFHYSYRRGGQELDTTWCHCSRESAGRRIGSSDTPFQLPEGQRSGPHFSFQFL